MTSPDPYRAFPNSFKRRLLAGETLIGCWCSLANPITTEVLGVAGFDWLLLDGEHSPNDVDDLHPAADGAEGQRQRAGRAAVVERRGRDQAPARRRLLQLPGAVRRRPPTTRAAPSPRRAIRPRASAASRSRSAATASARSPTTSRGIDEQISVLVQIESRAGLEAAAEIAAVDGVDGVFVGPSDLAAALGHLGNANHPSVQAAIAAVFAAAKAAGKPIGILAPVEADARRYLAMGATFVAVGSDLGVFRSATQQLRDRFARSG